MRRLLLAALLCTPHLTMAGTDVLQAADVLDYRQLKAQGLADAKREVYCCTSSTGHGFTSSDRISFSSRDGYFEPTSVLDWFLMDMVTDLAWTCRSSRGAETPLQRHQPTGKNLIS
ncbi:hypothetical protein [Cupriavidus plantarum]|uniref:Uncharacterized protein n=1 Tax=Cupriavidus plantarum TaxID=942865 RepID=A0A316F8Q8_9BURK|nr:hypothetical protein [Cupriavidus plantarum]PWK33465.1 hypothetical protein C7419_104140 [Cupriavidus plantarum]